MHINIQDRITPGVKGPLKTPTKPSNLTAASSLPGRGGKSSPKEKHDIPGTYMYKYVCLWLYIHVYI
jgi:hypothetical protein